MSWKMTKAGAGNLYVHEIDGPPRAYFSVPTNYFANVDAELTSAHMPGAVRLQERLVYRSFVFTGPREQGMQAAEHRRRAVIATLCAHVSRPENEDLLFALVIWRQRPEYVPGDERVGLTAGVRMRLCTFPDLTPRLWSDLEAADRFLGVRTYTRAEL